MGTTHLVCLLPAHELEVCGVPQLESATVAAGIEFLELPIADGCVPSDISQGFELARRLAELVRDGSKVVVHCRGGLGRSGLIGASVLLAMGHVGSAAEAMTLTRARRPGAIENRRQEHYVQQVARRLGLPVDAHEELLADTAAGEPSAARRSSRIRGAVLGLAVGDALGAPVEGQSADSIAATHGRLTEMVAGGPWLAGEWTDDTALMIATAEAYSERDFMPKQACAAMVRWLASGPKDVGRLTAAAISAMQTLGVDPLRAGDVVRRRRRRHAAGNGSLMRALPTGLVRPPGERLCDESRVLSELTHADRRCVAACVAFNTAVSAMAHCGAEPRLAIALAANASRQLNAEVAATCDAAVRGAPARYADRAIGYVLLTLERALIATRDATTFEDGLVDVVAMGGDTDTNAAVAGALLGARFGEAAIPERWTGVLRGRRALLAVAEKLGAGGADPRDSGSGPVQVDWPTRLTVSQPRLVTPGLAIYPLHGGETAPAYVSLGVAQQGGVVTLAEQEEGASVAKIEVEVRGERAVLVLEGELLEGALQNRVVDMTLLLPPGRHLVPVSCVEQGRWAPKAGARRWYRDATEETTTRRGEREFVAARISLHRAVRRSRLRHTASHMRQDGRISSDQGETWRAVDEVLRSNGVTAEAGDVLDLYEDRWQSLEGVIEHAEPASDQVGAVFAVDGKIVGLEVVGAPSIWSQVWRSVTSSYACEALPGQGTPRSEAPPALEEAIRFLHRARRCEWAPISTHVGSGVHSVAQGELTGFVFRAHAELLHAVALA